MDLFEALGERIGREFAGRRDAVPKALLYAPEAAQGLAESLRAETSGRRALVLFDARTREAGGPACLDALRRAGWDAAECLIPDRNGRSPVCDDATKDDLRAQLPGADVSVAVGSGVVNDLTKWLSAEAGVPYAVFATAASMNGYSASNVAAKIRGVKTLARARAPRIVAADPRIIEGAPSALTAAGLGDAVAKPVSTADWRMNHRLFGEDYSDALAGLIDDLEPRYLENAGALGKRESAATRALFEALIYSGCAMTLQGSSLPASGGEHLISHTLDMMDDLDRKGHDLHGRQVGVATIFAAALYERIMAIENPRFVAGAVPFDPALWGPIAKDVEAEVRKKKAKVAQACAILAEPGRFAALKADLAPLLRPPEGIKDCLRKAGAAHRVEDLGCTRERFLTAVRNCAAIRARFTSIDLALALGVLPASAEEIVDRWLV